MDASMHDDGRANRAFEATTALTTTTTGDEDGARIDIMGVARRMMRRCCGSCIRAGPVDDDRSRRW